MKDFNYKICLIGMPGSGKTTISKEIAKKIGYNFKDLDQEITNKIGLNIPDIFKIKGELFFRSVETEELINLIEMNHKTVISTGGGTILHNETILKKTFNIYLKCDRDILISRIMKNKDRPLINKDISKSIDNILKDREKIYSKLSNITIISNGNKKEIVQGILRNLKK